MESHVSMVLGAAVTILQCAMYERGGQSVSALAAGSCSAMVVTAAVYGVLVWTGAWGFTALGWLTVLSYFKLFVTCVKYIPQVHGVNTCQIVLSRNSSRARTSDF